MSYDTGFSRRSSSERDLQPVAIVAVDPTTRTATAVTRTRHTLYVNCAYATGDTITTPAVGDQWYVERFAGEWRLYGRIPHNDATLNIKPEEGQVSVGSASGPLELNGTEVRLNGQTVRLNGVYYRDNGETLQRSEDQITWETVLSAVEGDSGAIQLISEALTNFTGTDQQDALKALRDWSEVIQSLTDEAPSAWGEISQNAFVDGLRRMGTGDTNIAKVVDGGQNFIDYLFGILFCDFDGNLTPQTILSRTRDIATPISRRPLIQKFVRAAEQNGEGDTFLEKVFYGFENLFNLGGDDGGGGLGGIRRRFGNLLLDPGAEYKELWVAQSNVVEWVGDLPERPDPDNPDGPALPADPTRHGVGQLKIVDGGTDKTFWWTIDDLGEPEWLDTKEGEIYYAEAWVRSPVRNGGTNSTAHLILQLKNSKTGATDTKYVVKTINQDETWRLQNKISGTFTVPGPNQARPRYRTEEDVEWDQIRFGFKLVSSQSWDDDVFFVDDMMVKEITGVQRILKGIHEPIFGDNIEYPTYDDMQRGVLRLMRRRLGPNLLGDPKIQKEEFWADIPSVEFVTKSLTNKTRSGLRSLKVYSAGTTEISFDWMRDETGTVWPIQTEGDDIFYVECWVFSPLSNDPDSVITIHGIAVDTASEDFESTDKTVARYTKRVELEPLVQDTLTRGLWHKVSGYYIMPEPNNTEGQEAIYDGFVAGLTLKSGETDIDDVFYVDDLEVREVSDVQNLTDAVHIGLFGNNGRLNRPESVERRMRNLAGLSRQQKRLGPNLLIDPGAEFPEFWESQSSNIGISAENEASRSGTRSFKMISPGNDSSKTFWWNINDLGEISPIFTQSKEIFYVECHVLALTTNNGAGNVTLVAEVSNSVTGESREYFVPALITKRNAWIDDNKVHARFTIPDSFTLPDPTPAEPNRTKTVTGIDRVKFGFRLVQGATFENDIFFIDDLVVHEITGVQRTLKSIHEPIFGDSTEYPTYEDVYGGIRGLVNFIRKRAWQATNLVTDSKIENDNDWWVRTGNDAIPGLAVVERTLSNLIPVRSRKQSLRLTSAGSTPRSFDLLRDDLGAPNPVTTQSGDVFYVECWVYSPGPLDAGAANSTSATITVQGFAIDSTAEQNDSGRIRELVGAESNPAPLVDPIRGSWHKISGYYTIPAPDGDNIYDGLQVAVTLKANQTESGDVFYFDDLIVREVTEAQVVQSRINRVKKARRNRDAAAPNLLIDPSAELPEFWESQDDQVEWATDRQRSGTGSLKVTSAGSASRTFWWTIDEDGEPNPIITQEGEVFYAECYVLAPTGTSGNTDVTLVVEASNSITGATTEAFVPDTIVKSNLWLTGNKVSGNYTVPAGYDRLRFGFRLVGNATTAGATFYVDDMVVKEITGLQRTWNSLHQAVFGESSTDKTYDEAARGIKGLALFLRSRHQAGTNLITDPKIGNENCWSDIDGVVVTTDRRRSWTQALAITSAGATARSFDWMRDDTGAVKPIITQANDAFYVECWVYSPLSNNANATITVHGKAIDSSNGYTTTLVPAVSKVNPTRTNWVKISGYYTIPESTVALIEGVETEINYDNFVAGITLGAGATTSGNVFYIDDLLVREVTLAQATVDQLHQGIFGGTGRWNDPTSIRTGILGLANLGRGRASAGSNLLADPKVRKEEFWTGASNLQVVTQPRRSLTRSLELTSQGSSGESRFDWTVDDTGALAPIVTAPGDVFYVECYVYSGSTNSAIGTVTLHGHVVDLDNPDVRTSITPKIQAINPVPGGGWVKMSGTYTIPDPVAVGGVTPVYDGFIAGITLEQGATTLNNKFYFDDLVVREITEARSAKTAASEAISIADRAVALARRKQRAGANLVLDSKVASNSEDSYWIQTGNPDLAIYTYSGGTSYKRSGARSLAVTIPAAGTTSFALTLDDDGQAVPMAAQTDDVFYAEVWIRTATSATVTLTGKWVDSTGAVSTSQTLATHPKALSSGENWFKLSGRFAIPSTESDYDSLLVELTVAGTAGRVVYVDDILVRENTAAQNITDNIQQSVFGGNATNNDPGVIKTALQGLAGLGRNRAAAGSNLLADPKVNSAAFWSGQTGLAVVGFPSPRRSLSQSLELTSAGSTARSFYWTVDDTASLTPIIAREGDIFYCECWVYSPLSNSSSAVITLYGQAINSITGAVSNLTPYTLVNPVRAGWRKLSGNFTIPISGLTDSSYDQFVVGISLNSSATTSGNSFYFDDLVVREITVAQEASLVAAAASQNASTASGVASGAQNTANTAATDLQTTVDGVVQAVDGGSATGNSPVTTKTKLQLAWARIFDGMYGNALGTNTSKITSEMHTAGTALRSAATTAQTTATGANTAASTATTNLQTAVDGVVQAVDGGSATGNSASTTKTKLQLAWARIFDGMYGNALGTNTSKITSEMHTAGTALRSAATTAQTTATGANTAASTAQGTANTATTNLQTTVDGVVQAVDGSTATGANASATKTKLQLAWARIFDGLYNNASGTNTAKSASDLHTAGAALRSATTTAQTTATGANTAASTADGKAVAAQSSALSAEAVAQLTSASNGLVLSPDFEDSRVVRDPWYSDPAAIPEVTYTTEQPGTGTQSLKIRMTGAGSPAEFYGVRFNQTTKGGSPRITAWPCIAGEVYKYDLLVYSKSTNTGNRQLYLITQYFRLSNGTFGNGNTVQQNTQLKGQWQRWTGTFTVPATVDGTSEPIGFHMLFGFGPGTGALNDTVYLDRCLVYRQ